MLHVEHAKYMDFASQQRDDILSIPRIPTNPI